MPRLPLAVNCFLWLALCLPMESRAQDGNRHMLLLLPDRLLHLQVTVTDRGESLATRREKYIHQLISRLDKNQDGQLTSAETSKHPLFVQGRRFDGNKFLETLKSRRPLSSAKGAAANSAVTEVELAVERAAGKLLTFRQNSLVSDQDNAVFRVLDEDASGVIDRVEMRTATARIAARDKDFDQCITRDEFLDNINDGTGTVVTTASEPPDSVHSEMLRDASEPIVARMVMRRYDKNHDNQLTAEEIGWPNSRVQQLDANQSRSLDPLELAGLNRQPPDLVFLVDLDDKQLSLKLQGGTLSDSLTSSGDTVVVSKDSLTPLTFEVANRDVIAEALQNSQVAFNAIDADQNGYLDRKEIAEHQRFERYLFDAMDANDDNRVFNSEMQDYVKEYTEPATTTCQVTIFSMGFGIFQMLDRNSDGRISIRELRGCEQSLLKHSSADQSIDGDKQGSSYRIEFQRGGVDLFGRVDRPQAQATPAVLSFGSGPVWFQRMDRNSDGDLVWDEFLGPRDVFHELDTDGDNLVDTQEAIAYEKKLNMAKLP